ncbi:MAG: MtrB/PioB family outer membrane beta-barrel protein [Pseudomonadota bacterium]
MNRKIVTIPLTVAVMFSPLASAMAENGDFSGEVTALGQATHVNGDRAKFEKFSDWYEGIHGAVGFNYDKNDAFARFYATEIGADTQEFTLNGGRWDKFKFTLNYNEIPHNLAYDAKTFYSGAGHSSLGLQGDPADVSTWSSFDYATERNRFGGNLKLTFLKPFFLEVSAQSEKKDGIKPTSFGDLSGGGILTELPEPVNYRTDFLQIEGGYSQKPFFASLSYSTSRFSNDNPALDFYDTFTASTSTVMLAPDNDDYKFAFKGAAFLPYNSKFSLNTSSSRATSEADAINSGFLLESFDGKVDTDVLDLSLTSHPVSFVDGKLFYKYYDRDNQSDVSNGDPFFPGTVPKLDYSKDTYGVNLGFKLPEDFRLGLDYTDDRTKYDNRYDAKERTDDIYSADLAWSGLDMAIFTIGYELLHRKSDRGGTASVTNFDNMWRSDVAPADRDTYKASVDVSPLDTLSVTLTYKYKKTDYDDSPLTAFWPDGWGLNETSGHEFLVDASYALGKSANLYGYFDYEKVRSEQSASSTTDPATDWTLDQKENNFDYGVGADIFIIPDELTIKVQYDYVRSNGFADFTYLNIATPAEADIDNWGDYRKKAISFKAIYEMTPKITLTGGFAYEKFSMEDILADGYQYLPGGQTAYLTGASRDQSYEANIVYTSLAYRF